MSSMRAVTSALCLLFWNAPAWAASLKCGVSLVSEGDTKVDVRAKCGAPASEETRTIVVAQWVAPGQQIWVQKKVDEWLYTGGPHRLNQFVLFENGRVIDITSGHYGAQPSGKP
jgi:hypothetical protein